METKDAKIAKYKATDGHQDKFFTSRKSAVAWARVASCYGTVIIAKKDTNSWGFMGRFRYGRAA